MDLLDRGRGPALLLVHGFPLDRRTWEAQVGPLSGRFRVIAPDLPGFGKSSLLPAPASMDEAARGILSLLDSLGVDRFAAAGHSMGGYLVFALHRLAPDRLTGVGLVSTRAKADTDEARRARGETADRALREGPGFLAESMPVRLTADGAPAGLLDLLRSIMRQAAAGAVAAWSRAMASRPDATPQLERIAVPTVVVAGRKDKIVPPAESEAMAAAIPGALRVWCERSGHLPMMEEPESVTAALLRLQG
jgi:pimeloyl-ACP methyl ester carboxylesterase